MEVRGEPLALSPEALGAPPLIIRKASHKCAITGDAVQWWFGVNGRPELRSIRASIGAELDE